MHLREGMTVKTEHGPGVVQKLIQTKPAEAGAHRMDTNAEKSSPVGLLAPASEDSRLPLIRHRG